MGLDFGKDIGTACSSFAITNIDDMFVLVTFFADATTSKNLTPLKITIGQYVGFTVIIIISMIGFGASLVLPSEPIGFLGLMPLLLGVWKGLVLVFPEDEEDEKLNDNLAGLRSILNVAAVTVMNGGDNLGAYIPLFSQTKGPGIAVYVVVYYILLGIWCGVAFLIMRQKHILGIAQKYARFIIPLLYMGLGIYIIVGSDAYPWSIERIDNAFFANPGKLIMGCITAFLILCAIGTMLYFKMRAKPIRLTPSDGSVPEGTLQHESETENPEAGDLAADHDSLTISSVPRAPEEGDFGKDGQKGAAVRPSRPPRHDHWGLQISEESIGLLEAPTGR